MTANLAIEFSDVEDAQFCGTTQDQLREDRQWAREWAPDVTVLHLQDLLTERVEWLKTAVREGWPEDDVFEAATSVAATAQHIGLGEG